MMKKSPSRWPAFAIFFVSLWALYHILPTFFYYRHPLQDPITNERARAIAEKIDSRLVQLDVDSTQWVLQFYRGLGLKVESIQPASRDPHLLVLAFDSEQTCARARRAMEQAGSTLPFTSQRFVPLPASFSSPVQLLLYREVAHPTSRQTPLPLAFMEKWNGEKKIDSAYRNEIYDRFAFLFSSIAGKSADEEMVISLFSEEELDYEQSALLFSFAERVATMAELFGPTHPAFLRFLRSLFPSDKAAHYASQWNAQLEKACTAREKQLKQERQQQETWKTAEVWYADKSEEELQRKEAEYQRWQELRESMQSIQPAFVSDHFPAAWSDKTAWQEQKEQLRQEGEKTGAERFVFPARHPFVSAVDFDWHRDRVFLLLHEDIQRELLYDPQDSQELARRELIERDLIQTLTQLTAPLGVDVVRDGLSFSFPLHRLSGSTSLLKLDLQPLALSECDALSAFLRDYWKRSHPDLQQSHFPIRDYSAFSAESASQKSSGLVLYAPCNNAENPLKGFKSDSLYVITRGFASLSAPYRNGDELGKEGEEFQGDVKALFELLRARGFRAVSGEEFSDAEWLKGELVFEKALWFVPLIQATKEEVWIAPEFNAAIIECSTVQQRLLRQNAIETQQHEELIQWRDLYQKAQLETKRSNRQPLFFPPPHNVFWHNLLLSAKKYFRGDERKILRWGLDLSGGKTVHIALMDENSQRITDEESLQQAREELNRRVNKMGVSEVNIRIEKEALLLDFPSSQDFSARELIEGSTMSFHVVNEKFVGDNEEWGKEVNAFLQRVWNEATLTHRTRLDELNQIAARHLGYDGDDAAATVDPYAKKLREEGLIIRPLSETKASSQLDETLSMVVAYRDSEEQIARQGHPLEIVFRNYALQGRHLRDVQPAYDAMNGHSLHFSVATQEEESDINPQSHFFAWTDQFAKNRVAGTAKDRYSSSEGWRMAILLNGEVLTAARLSSPLSHSASITGRFSEREAARLAADLRAGTLRFTPKILSEQSVSPELGKQERVRGLVASLIGLLLVVGLMVGYYRFFGVVASIALFFNLLLLWAMLQNMGAVLSLAGIAGLILTVGMAVDTNVLIFERIREEFAKTRRLSSAIKVGYKKAFSAIFDSNCTTIVVALILISFDSGPVKGFAVSLSLGLLASLFTALFMTKQFFFRWMEKGANRTLNMVCWVTKGSFSFLRHGKKVMIFAAIIVVMGVVSFVRCQHSFVGMDFRGGYSLSIECEKDDRGEYRKRIGELFEKQGIAAHDYALQALGREDYLRIYLSAHLDDEGEPFYLLPDERLPVSMTHPFEKNPRLQWIVNTLQEGGIAIRENTLSRLHDQWSHTSGQLSSVTRNAALMSVGLALLFTFCYIALRFEVKFAVGAMVALLHDVLVTFALLALFHMMGLSIQLDMNVIAALLTIIGYSLNDTIVVFDRVREETTKQLKSGFEKVVDRCLHQTLSRTVLTSGTTLLVLVSLLVIGGPGLLTFSLTMTIGVIVGTISSLFIASPVMLLVHKRQKG